MWCVLLQMDVDVLDNLLPQNNFGPLDAVYRTFLKDLGTVRAERIDTANIMRWLTIYLPDVLEN